MDEVESFLRGVASAPPLRPPPRIGERLAGRYVIEEFLGEGGMGSVYRALDETLGERVALKLVKRGIDEEVLRDEVRLAQKVTHVNVCRIFDLEEVDGRQVVKMEYIAGETLAKRLEREGKLPIGEAVRIARAIAAGLAAAHAQGIVHSDLKPGNVMLVATRVVLMDFGVAHLDAAASASGRGTVGYLAPEKLRELSGDARSDHYALGCVVYEMLVGEPVFGRGSPSSSPTLRDGPAGSAVRAKRAEVPRWLDRAVGRLLSEEPASRIRGVEQLQSGPSARRFIVPAALLAIVATIVGWHVLHAPAWSPQIWSAEPHLENLFDPAVSPDGAWIAFTTDRYSGKQELSDLALVSVKSKQTFRLVHSSRVQAQGSARWLDDHTLLFVAKSNGEGRMYRQTVAFDPPRFVGTAQLISPPGVTNVASADVCGDAVVYLRWTIGAPMELWSTTSDRPLFMGVGTQSLSGPRCDHSGKHVAIVSSSGFFSSGDLYVIDLPSGAKHQLTDDAKIEDGAVFSADGSSILTSRHEDASTQLYAIAAGGGEWRRLTFDEQPDISPDVSLDGRTVAFTRDTSLFLVTISGKGYVTNEKASHIRPRALDADHIVTQRSGDGPAEITVVQISTGDVARLAEGTDPFPSFDRRTIYFVPHDRRFLAAVPADGGATKYVATLPGKIIGGCGGFDGVHVLVQIGEQEASYRVSANGAITDDHTSGIVCVASSGWRAITKFADATHKHPQLTLEAPDGRTQTLEVHSLFNRWLDDHRVTYCLKDCRVLDVLTNQTTVLAPSTAVDGMLAVVTDDLRIVDWAFESRASLHAITNFADR